MKKMSQKASEISHFSQLDHIWWGTKTLAGQKRYNNKALLLKKKCRLKKGMKILEVGCGDGEFTQRIAKISLLKTKITAIDVTPAVIKRAKQKIKNKKILYKVGNLEKLDFKKNSFDLVCGISILHHANLKKALLEIYRVLKKDGEVFFTEPNILNPNTFLGLKIPFLRKKMEFSPDETAFKKWQLKNDLTEAGFKNIEVRNIDFLHPLTPASLIKFVEKIGAILEKIPLIKEISGSLMIYARKT